MTQRKGSKVGLLVLHGMGSQIEDYWRKFDTALMAALGGLAGRFHLEPVYWAEALENPEKRLWFAMNRSCDPECRTIDLHWRGLRRFIVHSFADALGYDRPGPGSRYEEVHRIVDDKVRKLYAAVGDDAPVVVVAHSLGAHIASNYIWDTEARPSHRADCDGSDADPPSRPPSAPWRPIDTLAGMVTFGANIPLFSLSFENPQPIVLPGAGLAHRGLRDHAGWLNFLDVDDVLGWPLRNLYDPKVQQQAKEAARSTELPRTDIAKLGRTIEASSATQAPPSEGSPALHCRRRETVRRIRDIRINVGSWLWSWNFFSHGHYWKDRNLVQPTATYLRNLVAILDS